MTDHIDPNHGDYEGDKQHPIFGTRKRPTRHDQMAMITKEITNMNERREWLADHYIGPVNEQDHRRTHRPTDQGHPLHHSH